MNAVPGVQIDSTGVRAKAGDPTPTPPSPTNI